MHLKSPRKSFQAKVNIPKMSLCTANISRLHGSY